MNLTLDLEWSRKLKAAGIEGEVSHWWHTNPSWEKDKRYAQHHVHDDYVPFAPRFIMIAPAYTLEELLAMVEGDYWWYYSKSEDTYEFRIMGQGFFADTDPKEAVCEALLWQKGAER